jgi:HlyD family secretion protein
LTVAKESIVAGVFLLVRAGQVLLPRFPSIESIGLAVAVVALAYCDTASPAWADDSNGEFAAAVTVVEVKRDCFVDTLEVTGVVQPRNEILVRPAREGYHITQVLVQPGDAVISGQVLARLKPPEGVNDSGPDTAVRAPDAGVIFAISAIVGASASAMAEPLFRIAKGGEMELDAETPVNTMSRLVVGQQAKVDIIGVSGELSGKVQFISAAINQTSQLGQVHIFLGADRRLRVGAFGRARIEIEQRCGPAVELSAVLYSQGMAVAQVVRDDRIETRRITVGIIKAENAEIRDGLSEGEVVVSRAGAFVRDGDRVRAVTPGKPIDQQ